MGVISLQAQKQHKSQKRAIDNSCKAGYETSRLQTSSSSTIAGDGDLQVRLEDATRPSATVLCPLTARVSEDWYALCDNEA